MKRFLSVLLCSLLLLSLAAPLVSARFSYTNYTDTGIGIVSGKAIGVGDLEGYQGITTKVEITLTLQRRLKGTTGWSTYVSGTKQTFNNWYGTSSLSKASIDKGYEYRTKAVYVAWSGSKSETITDYSPAMGY